MKRKHQGVAAIVCTLGTFILTIFFIWNAPSGQTPYRKKMMMDQADNLSLPDTETLKTMSMLFLEMPGLVFPDGNASTAEGAVDLSMFGYRPEDENWMSGQSEKSKNENQETTLTEMAYALSFSFSSGTKKYCIVDGKFYSEGADLADGGKIELITPNAIWVRKNGFGKWIYVTGPKMNDPSTQTDSTKH